MRVKTDCHASWVIDNIGPNASSVHKPEYIYLHILYTYIIWLNHPSDGLSLNPEQQFQAKTAPLRKASLNTQSIRLPDHWVLQSFRNYK